MWIRILSVAAALALVAGIAYLLRKTRRLKNEAATWAQVAKFNHDTVYRMSCDRYGKAATDRAIREAHARGGN